MQAIALRPKTPALRDVVSSGRWAATGVLAATILLDLSYGREASLAVTLVFAPFVASALLTPSDTRRFGIAAVLATYALGWPDHDAGTSPQLVRTLAVALGAALALRIAVERTRRESKLAAVTNVAEVAQQAILHPMPSRLGPLKLEARYLSASEEAHVGGDFYEAVDSPFGVRIVVGDVRGKGLEAVRLTALLLGEFRSRAASEPDLGAVVEALDRVVTEAGADEDFATALFAELDGDQLRLVRCAHPQPLCRSAGGAISELQIPGTLPLGFDASADAGSATTMPPGTQLLFYSDGAIETHDRLGHDFDLKRSFAAASAGIGRCTALDDVLRDLHDHAGGPIKDDVVLVLIASDGA